MRLLRSIALICVSMFGVTMCSTPGAVTAAATTALPPVAEKQPKTITVHGDSRVDDYFWLREKTNPT